MYSILIWRAFLLLEFFKSVTVFVCSRRRKRPSAGDSQRMEEEQTEEMRWVRVYYGLVIAVERDPPPPPPPGRRDVWPKRVTPQFVFSLDKCHVYDVSSPPCNLCTHVKEFAAT